MLLFPNFQLSGSIEKYKKILAPQEKVEMTLLVLYFISRVLVIITLLSTAFGTTLFLSQANTFPET